ncbi:MAG: recombinase family protein [Phascolarctobacterium sp.]|nr:recombinase family protein [Phascolarctobacterium sp.]
MANVLYLRVSSKQQDLIRQKYVFEKQNIIFDKVFEEKISAKDTNRPKFKEMMDWLREGDVLYVESFSRLARNTRDLLDIVDKLKNKEVKIVSLKEDFDTDSSHGKMILGIFALLYSFERECMLERQKEAFEARRAANLPVGRPRVRMSESFGKNYHRWKTGEITATQCMKEENLSRTTFYKLVKDYEKENRSSTC